MTAGDELVRQETERSAADDLCELLERIGGGQPRRHDHRLRLHLRQEMRQQRERLLQPPHQRAVVRCLDRIDPRVEGLADRVALQPALQRGDAVARQNRRAVVEHQSLAQLHRPAFAVVVDRVAFDHLRLRVERLVAAVQRLVDHQREVAGDGRGGPHRIEAGQVGLRHEDQGLRGGADRRAGERQGGRRGGGCDEGTAFHGRSLPGWSVRCGFRRFGGATQPCGGGRRSPGVWCYRDGGSRFSIRRAA